MLILLPLSLQAGHEHKAVGAEAAALANNHIMLNGIWAVTNNQAGMVYLTAPTAGLAYVNQFLVKELSYQSVAFSYPLKKVAFGLDASFTGDALYREMSVGLAFGMRLTPDFAAGLKVDYLSTRIDAESFVPLNLVTFELGWLFQVTDEIRMAAHTFNPFQQKFSTSDADDVPASYALGFSFLVAEPLTVVMEAEKISGYTESIKVGIAYKAARATYIRAGVASNPALFSFGFESAYKNIHLQLSASHHPVLGFSPGVSMFIEW